MGCKRGTRLQFVLVEPRVYDVFVSSLFYPVGPRSSPLFIYTFSSLLGPPCCCCCCCWACLACSPRSLSIEPMQHFKANLPRVAVNAKQQCPALQTITHPLTVVASVSVSVLVSACHYCLPFPPQDRPAMLSLRSTKERNPGVWTWTRELGKKLCGVNIVRVPHTPYSCYGRRIAYFGARRDGGLVIEESGQLDWAVQ
jgi:hypothetical protein